MNVLIVEDENTKYNDIHATLKSMCIEKIQRAYNAKEALTLLRTNNYNLMLLDMTMPFAPDNRQLNSLAGKELLFDMITEEVDVPSIVVTCYSSFGPVGKLNYSEDSSLTYLYNENFGLDLSDSDSINENKFDITTFEGIHKYLKYNIPFYVGIVYFTQQNNSWKKYLKEIMENIK